MPYAVRNAQGQLVSLHRHDPGVGEQVSASSPEVRAFLGLDAQAESALHPAPEEFDRLDADFIRVLEDVIDALTSRNVINITDLPDMAQSKLFNRRSFRERRPKSALDLFRPGDLGDVI
jgi:hypothetical protein